MNHAYDIKLEADTRHGLQNLLTLFNFGNNCGRLW